MPLVSAGLCDIGQKRKTNQDSIYLNQKRNLFIVADGMGGHNGGDIASAMAVKFFPEYALDHLDQDPKEALNKSVLYANDKIIQRAQKEEELQGMGTTIVACYFHGPYLYLANVGDSRAYMVQNKKLFQMTKDHSWVQEKLNMGIYGREEAKKDPQKNYLVRTVGVEENLNVDVYTYKVNRGDIFLICSDGLHGLVSDQDILYLINQHLQSPCECQSQQLESCAQALVDTANQNGGQDNISAILIVAK